MACNIEDSLLLYYHSLLFVEDPLKPSFDTNFIKIVEVVGLAFYLLLGGFLAKIGGSRFSKCVK